MKYQRVLYTNKFSTELKSKLRISSYNKRQSLKGNVYYVSFASNADVAYADRVCKRLRNVTMKPFQPRSSNDIKYQRPSNRYNQEKLYESTSSTSSESPSTSITYIPVINSSAIIDNLNSLQCDNGICEERSIQIHNPPKEINNQVVELSSNIQKSNFNKQQVINNIQSCLNTMKITQHASDHICQLYKDGINCNVALNHLLQTHSTAFYLKAATSIQIKDLLSAGVRLSWPDLANNINEFRTAVGHERSFMTKLVSAKHILSKIDNETSITMSSKLAYQLTKLSH